MLDIIVNIKRGHEYKNMLDNIVNIKRGYEYENEAVVNVHKIMNKLLRKDKYIEEHSKAFYA